jgi:hypothetical protein
MYEDGKLGGELALAFVKGKNPLDKLVPVKEPEGEKKPPGGK